MKRETYTEKVRRLEDEVDGLKKLVEKLSCRRGKLRGVVNITAGICLSTLIITVTLYAAQVIFYDGGIISASDINSNFTELYDRFAEYALADHDHSWSEIPDVPADIADGDDDTVFPDVSVKLTKSTHSNVIPQTWNTLTFDTEIFDEHDMHDLSVNTERITISEAGKYLVTGEIYITNTNGDGYVCCAINLNSNMYISYSAIDSQTHVTKLNCTAIVKLDVDDFLTLEEYHSCYYGLTIAGLEYLTSFTAIKLSE